MPAQVDVAVASGPEPKGDGGGNVFGMHVAHQYHIQVISDHILEVLEFTPEIESRRAKLRIKLSDQMKSGNLY